MKSQVQRITHVVQGILADAKAAYPLMCRSFSQDEKRLHTLVQSRGMGFYSLDLPNLDNLLLAGLERGRLYLEGPLCHAVSKRIRVPRLFSGLWLRIFDKQGVLKTDYDVNSVLFLRQLCCFGKKIEVVCSPKRLFATEEKYLEIESEARAPTFQWDREAPFVYGDYHSIHFRDGFDNRYFQRNRTGKVREADRLGAILDKLQLISAQVSSALGYYDPYTFTSGQGTDDRRIFRHGPGAVSDLKTGENKYDFPSWSDKLQVIFPYDAFGTYAPCAKIGNIGTPSSPSKLCAVPKTAKAPRLIASEPAAHQWCQQVTWAWLRERIRSSSYLRDFIDFSSQEKSQVLTIEASLNGDLCTVDLSSASDRLTCWVVERVFKSNRTLLEALHAHRTSHINVNLTGRRILLHQKKFASQGTAVTFPIQTLVFLCCVLAVLPGRNLQDTWRRWKGKVRVYGDDIIMPTLGYGDLRLLLDYLGLKVNDDKSFHSGPFRESCGMDALGGFNVTPVKPLSLRSDTPAAKAALIDASNNLFERGFWCAARAVESIPGYPSKRILPVVGIGSGVVGRTSFCGAFHDHLDKRWNEDLHRIEARVWATVSLTRRRPINDTTAFFQYISEKPDPLTKWESGTAVRPKLREKRRWEALWNLAEPVS